MYEFRLVIYVMVIRWYDFYRMYKVLDERFDFSSVERTIHLYLKKRKGYNMKKEKRTFRKVVEKIAIKVAKTDANTACSCISYQPKLPEAVKKLRKS